MKCCPLYLPSVAALLLVLVGSGIADEAQDDWKRLQGTWTVESGTMGGAPMNPGLIEDMKWIFAGEELTWLDGGGSKTNVIVKLDPTQTPKWVDLAPFTGAETRPVFKGVYQLDSGVLKVCYHSGGARPDSVESEPANLNGHFELSYVLKLKNGSANVETPDGETKRSSRPGMPARMASVQGKGVVKKVDDELFIELSDGKKYLSREEKTNKICENFLGKGTLNLRFSAWDTKESEEWDGVLFSIRTMESVEKPDI